MDTLDFVIVGAGASGEAAAFEARRHGAGVAIVDRELFGGSGPFWACMPSKSLLHSAAVHHAGGAYPWARASAQRDYMINREGRDRPDDAGHVHELDKAGARVVHGGARIVGPGRVDVETPDGTVSLSCRNLVLSLGSHARCPDNEGHVGARAVIIWE